MSNTTDNTILNDENHIIAERRTKLAQLRIDNQAYPNIAK